MSCSRVTAFVVLTAAIAYQWWLKDLLFVTLGIGRSLQPIEVFPFQCRPLKHKSLEACGDLWLDEDNRVLYAACTGMKSRQQWNPSLSRFNISGRRSEGSGLIAIYIDQPREDGFFKMHAIQPTKYGSDPGDGRLDLGGFDVQAVDSYTLRFWLLNHRPLFNSNGRVCTRKAGMNITIDVYEHRRGEKKMSFVANSWSPTMHSPSKIAWMGSNNFVVANDRSAQAGLRRKLDTIFGGGTLVYYDDWFDRYTVTREKLPILGMILRGMDDRIYVPSQVDKTIRVFQNQEDRSFKKVFSIEMSMPIVSLTLDANGNMWALGRSKYDTEGANSRNSVFKIEQYDNRQLRYTVTKVLEDAGGKTIKEASIATYDVKTKRIFLSGAFASAITICEQKL